jgi:uncharacterized repeat protein (TIGR01451 family)
MSSNVLRSTLLESGVAACALLFASGAALADVNVTLTASPSATTLPDGQPVPMWGLLCGTVSGGTFAYSAGVDTSNAAAKPCTTMTGAPQTSTWQPPLITAPEGSALNITLFNNLSFTNSNTVPTSLVIVGQLGGGLGTDKATMPSPVHLPHGTTWPGTLGGIDTIGITAINVVNAGAGYTAAPNVTITGTGGGAATAVATVTAGAVTSIAVTNGGGYAIASVVIDPPTCVPGPGCVQATATATLDLTATGSADAPATFRAPPQVDRVRSMATEVKVSDTSGKVLTWSSLRKGTYLIESGTEPSIQGPMGLYGVLVVTESTANSAYGTPFDAALPVLLSEIDPVQNVEVAQVVQNPGFSDTTVWNGQAGGCGDINQAATAHTCYPPAVNYTPLYYLVNGKSFDRTSPTKLSVLVPPSVIAPVQATSGNVLLRLVNAGLRIHVPSIVGSSMTLLAEDSNPPPGSARVQSEVLLTAGKTYDVAVQPAQTGGNYVKATYPLFDRALNLSTSNQRDGGMQVLINVAGGAAPGAGLTATALSASSKTYSCVDGSTLSISDPTKGLLGGSVGANGVALSSTSLPTGASLNLQSNGTFTYTPPAVGPCAGSFSYNVNNTLALTATIQECGVGCAGDAPVARNAALTSNFASQIRVSPPGVLQYVTNSSGFALTAVAGLPASSNACGSVTINADGSFFATPATVPTTVPVTCNFNYNVSTSTKLASASDGTISVTFPVSSGLTVNVKDGPTGLPVSDYRWIIEEDRTFWVDPKCQINSTSLPPGCPSAAKGPWSMPPTPVESLGYNFHSANMPVIAGGCVGTVSCEVGQKLQGADAVCDVGNGACRTAAGAQKTPASPSDVYLDPNKRYFLSILPGDAINPTISGFGGTLNDCGAYTPGAAQWALYDPTSGSSGNCGHEMGGVQLAPGATSVSVSLQGIPLQTAKISVFVFEDDNPLNGENDAGGGVDVLAPNEPGLGGFEVKLFDQAGQLGDATGQITYDEFNEPVSNALAGYFDPLTGLDACPITNRKDGLVGMIPTCPKFESDGKHPSPLAGQVVVANLYPGLYEIQAYPAADRIAAGEEWLQTNTLDGGKPHEAFIIPSEPGYFQEFGPGGFHVAIGFASPATINARKDGYCGSALNGGQPCNNTLSLQITNAHMSRTPDQRTYSSETYDHYSWTNCYVSIGPADAPDFAFQKCTPDGNVTFTNMPPGVFKMAVFDQWNDIMLDGLVGTVEIGGGGVTTTKEFPVTQWRTNLATRTFIDTNGDGVSGAYDHSGTRCTGMDANGMPTPSGCNTNWGGNDTTGEAGLALVNTNIRYRDGSIGFFNNTDLNGYAGFNEVFPFMNWLVVETTQTRFKPTKTHVVYDAGGTVDCSQQSNQLLMPCTGVAANIANTNVRVPLPQDLRVAGAKYCDNADCPPDDPGNGASTGMLFPPQAFGNSIGWQGLLGQNTFIEFGYKPFKKATANTPAENGGISGQVIYASTRPFDDPTLLLQLSWEPGIPHATVNLYSKTVDDNGHEALKLVDTIKTASWDDWAQGFRKGADGTTLLTAGSGVNAGNVPNMNCPGQDATSPFFATLKNSKMYLDTPDSFGNKKPLAYQSQFKCYDGWSQLNQAQPAPYDGYYKFPSVTAIDPATGKPSKTNCTGCGTNPDDGTPMLPAGTYVVEVIPPTGYELVKEEDKNILMGDVYVAPVTQQFAGFGNIFILPDQAEVNSYYNPNSPGGLNLTNSLGAAPRHEGDTGSVETFWPCVGALRQVPDFNSEFPGAQQASPFAGAMRHLCDRKEVTLTAESSSLAKFYLFSDTHIAGHFTGTITNDFASEFDPFSPQFGEKFGPPNLPVGLRDFNGNEVARVYADQWGMYDGLYFSTWSPNPPNPTGYAPQMSIACMNDPGPITVNGVPTTDPAYNPAYSNFCYEQPFMPGDTTYMDTPVIPTQAFADNYNLPDSEYPDQTPAIKMVNGDGIGPWVGGIGNKVSAVALSAPNFGGSGYINPPTVNFSGGGGSGASAITKLSPSGVGGVTLTRNTSNSASGSGYVSSPGVAFGGGGTGAAATAFLGVGTVTITNTGQGSFASSNPTVTVLFSLPGCTLNATTCVRATGTVNMTTSNAGCDTTINNCSTAALRRRVTGITITNAGAGYTSAPTLTFSRGSAVAIASLGVSFVRIDAPGSGYVAPIPVTFTGGGGSGADASATVAPTSVASITVINGGSGYTSAPTVTIAAPPSGTRATATAQIAQTGQLVITSLGDKVIQNPYFAGPNATSAPYNQKTLTRHYGFGGTAGSAVLVAPDGSTTASLTIGVGDWTDAQIKATVPSLPNSFNCKVQQPGAPTAKCAQLVITRGDNGKRSVDAITVTVGGSAPWLVTQTDVTAPAGKTVKDYRTNFGRMNLVPGATNQSAIQVALDSAAPGDLIIVAPGTYRENLIMWKPVRLQGVGSGSVTVNADAHPAGHMDQWRRQIDCVFGLDLNGVPNPGDATFDPAGTYSCPSEMHERVDRIPFEAIVGWDAAGNGNLAQVLQEPTLMGAYEGAGITVLGRGVRIPLSSTDFWGVIATGGAGAFADGSRYLTGGNVNSNQAGQLGGAADTDGNDCLADSTLTDGRDYGTSNFYCNPSRVDGIAILNSSQGGGGLFLHGWTHNIEIANNRISANHGTLAGAINVGNGETPDAFINDGVECGVNPPGLVCPPVPNGTPTGAAIPFQFNVNVRIHHNMLWNNASIGDALFSGTPAGAGAITVSAGADNYLIDHNWIAGNLSTGDGGGLQHLGLSYNGQINNNYILFNQSTNPTLPTSGGGIVIEGANLDRMLNGTECGSTSDQDCPPGLSEGTGSVSLDGNLIYGNSAESGSGGGIRIQQVNGSADFIAFPTNSNNWYGVTLTNNIVANNVAGYDGGGVSLQDALKVALTNNTIASNDTTASAGVLFKTLGSIMSNTPPPGCKPQTDPTLPQDDSCLHRDAPHGPQPSGLVTMAHTPNLVDAINTLPGNINSNNNPKARCPSGFGYTNGSSGVNNADCLKFSRPALTNNMFWQNRTFHVDLDTTTPNDGLTSQQNLVVIAPGPLGNNTPLASQLTSGACPTGASYWDIGLRTDDVQAGVLTALANKLAVAYSLLTKTGDISNLSEVSLGSPNTNQVGPAGNQVYAPVCNGARVPPEYCTVGPGTNGQNGAASCRGYNVPPGASETTSLATVFRFDGIQPTATVDEGHNWLNLVYGPLYMGHPGTSIATPETATPTQLLVASASVGTTGSAYSLASGSAAANNGTPQAGVTSDYFGNARPTGGCGAFDIGAVQTSANPTCTMSITKDDARTTLYRGDTTTYTIVVTNTGAAPVTGAVVTDTRPNAFTSAGWSWSCVASAGASCGNTTSGNGNINATLGTLSPSSSVTFTVTALVAGNATAGAVTNTARVSYANGAGTSNPSISDTDTLVVGTTGAVSYTSSTLGALSGTTPRLLTLGQQSGNTAFTVTVSVTGASVTFGKASLTSQTFGGGAGTPYYTVTGDTCSNATVLAGGHCTVSFNFAAPAGASTTQRTGSFSLSDSGSGSPQVLNLTGS